MARECDTAGGGSDMRCVLNDLGACLANVPAAYQCRQMSAERVRELHARLSARVSRETIPKVKS